MEPLISCALKVVRKKEMGVRKAARVFGLKYETLRDRVNGATSKRGRPRHFTDEEEQELVSLTISCSDAGIALSKRIFFKVVMNAAIRKGIKTRETKK